MEVKRTKGKKLVALGLLLMAGLALFTDWPCRAEIAAIRGYQATASSWMGRFIQCRFRPTCSHYAVEALQGRGFFVGNALIAQRLALCSPVGLLFSYGETYPRPSQGAS